VRILVVEDNALSARLVREILTRRGHEVLEAVSVLEALAQVRSAPDLVIMDIEIVGGSGEEVLRGIKLQPHLCSIPVIAVTANAMQGERERLLAAGFDAYLSKPIDTRSFGATVESLLQRRATS
jgi:CheY-like chemotaxis protein